MVRIPESLPLISCEVTHPSCFYKVEIFFYKKFDVHALPYPKFHSNKQTHEQTKRALMFVILVHVNIYIIRYGIIDNIIAVAGEFNYQTVPKATWIRKGRCL